MKGPVFVDTNVLVYARDRSEGDKQRRALAWVERLWRTRTGRLSVQVLHEFYVTVTMKLRPGLDRDSARGDVRALRAWRPVNLDAGLLEDAWKLQDRHALSFWDALIIAGARATRSSHLLTEDLQDGAAYGGVEVANPFTREPGELALPHSLA